MDQKNTDKDDPTEPHEPPSTSKIPTIKIKIPKTLKQMEVEVEDEADQKEEIKKTHCCRECNKSFSSGKALGGHMSSAHVQANKDYSYKKPNFKKKTAAISPPAGIYSCMLCDKSFSSKKSLFGHMRCHPEREWRGMEPPPEMKDYISGAGASSEDGEVGLGFALKNWASSNKRGRAGMIRDNDLDLEKDESFAATLELIQKRKSGGGESSQRRRRVEEEENQDHDCNDERYLTAVQVLASVKREKMAAKEREKYRCIDCGRLFSTHQALGGHCSSHNKSKSSPESGLRKTKSSPESGQRKTKMTVFNTNGSSSRSSPVKEKSDDDGKIPASAFAFAFDLNMTPEEEEDGEIMSKEAANLAVSTSFGCR